MKSVYILILGIALVIGTFSGCTDNSPAVKTGKCGSGKCGDGKAKKDTTADKACKENTF